MSGGETRFGSLQRVPIGTTLNAMYTVDKLVAAGGMGEVYRGHNAQTGDEVAIKMILPELAENETAFALFRKEASVLNALYHEAIVRYYVFTVDPDLQQPYLAMEFVDGISLADRIETLPLNFDEARTLQKRLAEGLQKAHDLGVVHRDISPDNIILPGGDVARAKIIDFGIARAADIGGKTIIGDGFAGKYGFVSPEQLGLYGGDVQAQSDIYSLGLVLASALSGRTIDMGGTQVEVIEKRRQVPDLSGVDQQFLPLLTKMLQPKPDDRPASMTEVAEWPIKGDAKPAKAKASSGGGSKAVVFGAIAAVVLLAVAGGAYFALDVGGSSTTQTSEQTDQIRPDEPVSDGAQETASRADQNTSEEASTETEAREAERRAEEQQRAEANARAEAQRQAEQQRQAAEQQRQGAEAARLRDEQTKRLADRSERYQGPGGDVRRYIDRFAGGGCFLPQIVDATDQSADIVTFANEVAPAQNLVDSINADFGFDPDVQLRQVRAEQCPALSFAHAAQETGQFDLDIKLDTDEITNGSALVGRVQNAASQRVQMFLVSTDGQVFNITQMVDPNQAQPTLRLKINIPGLAVEAPSLLVAVASATGAAVANSGGPVSAEILFQTLSQTLLSETGHERIGLNYFLVKP